MSYTIDEAKLAILLKGIDIPPCPAVLLDIDEELRKGNSNQRIIARIISRDVALSGKVMQVANSPAFSTGQRINSISDALTVLGTRQTFNLVVTQLLKTALAGEPEVPMDRFWDSSATAARVASGLARRLKCIKPETAYTFSLFHDCGIPLLMKRFGDYRDVLEEANASESELFTDVEEARLGTNHSVVGYFLARRWKLPDFVAQGILLHHEYALLDDGTTEIDRDHQTVIAINVLAEHIARNFASQGEEREWTKAGDAVSTFLNVSTEKLSDVIEDMQDWLEECSFEVY